MNEVRTYSPIAYSLPDAARITGVSVVTIRREIARRQISVARIGRRIVIPGEALADYLKRRTVTSREAK